MKIAIVGSGVSGLVAAHHLSRRHEVTIFESSAQLGGHANTVEVKDPTGVLAVDTGFLVCNRNTYPNFLELLSELGISVAESDMSFSVRSERRNFEYCGRDLASLYVQRRHLLSPRFHRMVFDILRFYREGRALLTTDSDVPLLEWLEQRRFSRQFFEDHLGPMLRAVWSARRDVAENFPARFLVRFFNNHGFLTTDPQQPWLTIPGGSRRYVDAIAQRFPGTIRLETPVYGIRRRTTAQGDSVLLRTKEGTEHFEHVVVACHSDQALRLLEDPTEQEQEILGAFPYQRNDAVLHTDVSLMPRHRHAWASWNVHLDDQEADGACITYWLNSLQPLNTDTNYFVTLNHSKAIDPGKIVERFVYHHPVFTLEGVMKQARHHELIDHHATSYCGAYWRNGFHEDGVVSGLRVSERLGGATRARAA